MKVRCEYNNIFDLDDKSTVERLKKYIRLSDGQLNIEKNKEYFVYGIIFRDNAPWYYLCLDMDDEYPTPYPSDLFSVTDGRLSPCWRLSVIIHSDGSVMSSIIFKEWSKDSSFYERLVDGDPKAIEIFEKYRELINKE